MEWRFTDVERDGCHNSLHDIPGTCSPLGYTTTTTAATAAAAEQWITDLSDYFFLL